MGVEPSAAEPDDLHAHASPPQPADVVGTRGK